MAHDYTTDFTQAPPEEREFIVFEDGDYPFTILDIFNFEKSKKDNDMLPMVLQFTRPDGATVNVKEYLVFTELALFKIRQFIAACGIADGTRINFRDPAFIGWLKPKVGFATLGTETFIKKDGKEGKKNVIAKYVYEGTSKSAEPIRPAASLPPAHRPPPPVEEQEEDDIPF